MLAADPVVFVAQWGYAFEQVAPVCAELRRRGVPAEVVVVPERLSGDESGPTGGHYASEEAVLLHRLLAKEGWDPLPLLAPDEEADRLRALDPCALFLPSPYDAQRHPGLAGAELGLPVHMVDYFHRVAPDTVEGGTTVDPFYDLCEAVYCGSHWQQRAFVDSGLDPRVAVLTGHPGLDRWDLERPRSAEPTVMWCPWHVDRWPDGRRGYCTLVQARADVVAAMRARPEIRFIVRPHPLTFENLRRLGAWTAEEERSFREELAALPNVVVSDAAADSPEHQISQSWGMITDGLSFLAEYTYTGKPLLLTEAPGHPGWTPDGQALRAIVDTALVDDGVPGLEDFLDRVVAGPDPGREAAQRVAVAQVLHRPPGGAASAVADHVLAGRERRRARRAVARPAPERLSEDVLLGLEELGQPDERAGLPRLQVEVLRTGRVPWLGERVGAGALGGAWGDDQAAVVLDDQAGTVLLTGPRVDGWRIERLVQGDRVFRATGADAGEPLGSVVDVMGQQFADRVRLAREGLTPAGAPRRLMLGSGSPEIDAVTSLSAVVGLQAEVRALVDSGHVTVWVWPDGRPGLQALGGLPALLGDLAADARDWPRASTPAGVVPLAASRVSATLRERIRDAAGPAEETPRERGRPSIARLAGPRLWVGLTADQEGRLLAPEFVRELARQWSGAGGEVLVDDSLRDATSGLPRALAADVALVAGAPALRAAIWLAGRPTVAVIPPGDHRDAVVRWYRARSDDPPAVVPLPDTMVEALPDGSVEVGPLMAPRVAGLLRRLATSASGGPGARLMPVTAELREAPFGRVITAMATPFDADGELDLDAAASLAVDLVELGCDGVVVNGTTGESPTTSDEEKSRLLACVLEAVGDRARVIAGVGTNDTRHTLHLASLAHEAGAHGLLVVTPYYNKPSQDGLLAHFTAVADASDLPVMLYDIPGRSGVPISTETLLRLAEHPRIVANKDAKGDLWAAQQVMHHSDMVFYSGDDALNLPLLSVGAVGFVSVIGHLVADRLAAMVEAYLTGDVATATAINSSLVPVTDGIMYRVGGAVMVKAGLDLLGRAGGGAVRLPLVPATEQQRAALRDDLRAGGFDL